MSGNKRRESASILENLPIRWKIIIAALLIGSLLFFQGILSIQSVNSLADDKEASFHQSRFQQNVLRVGQNQRIEEGIILDYVTEQDPELLSILKQSFYSENNLTQGFFRDIELAYNNISETEASSELNLDQAQANLTSLMANRTEFLNIVKNEIFQLPSFERFSEFDTIVNGLQSALLNLTTAIIDYSKDPDPEEQALFDRNVGDSPLVLAETNNRLISDFINTLGNDSILDYGISQPLSSELRTTYDTGLVRFNVSNVFLPSIENMYALVQNTPYDNLTSSEQVEFDNLYLNATQAVDDANSVLNVMLDRMDTEKDKLIAALDAIDQITSTMQLLITDLVNWATTGLNVLNNNFNVTATIQEILIYIVLTVTIVLTIIITVILNKQIANPLTTVARWSQYISEGDLSKTQRIKRREDEVGQLQSNFVEMNLNLREIINEVQKSSALISDTSDDLAASTEEINATAEEVSAIAQTMAKGSTEQAEIITSIVQELNSASDVVNNVVSQITENLNTIQDLSEQTNILALNTAIEAANAGEFGKGFTVIAENIRKMSDQTKRTSKNVSQSSRAILSELQSSFNHIAEMIENVASVSEETAASAEEVAASAEEMTASMESIAANSSILNEQSVESLEVVRQFKLERDTDFKRTDKLQQIGNKETIEEENEEEKEEVKDTTTESDDELDEDEKPAK